MPGEKTIASSRRSIAILGLDSPAYQLPEERRRRSPSARIIEGFDVTPGPAPEVYAFSRASVQRNLYRLVLELRQKLNTGEKAAGAEFVALNLNNDHVIP